MSIIFQGGSESLFNNTTLIVTKFSSVHLEDHQVTYSQRHPWTESGAATLNDFEITRKREPKVIPCLNQLTLEFNEKVSWTPSCSSETVCRGMRRLETLNARP